MSKYGDIAILAARLFPDLQNARDAWALASELLAVQDQPVAPMNAFLTLCASGQVLGIPAEVEQEQLEEVALRGLRVLQQDAQPVTAQELWDRLHTPPSAPHEGQLEVVLGLWDVGLLRGELSGV